MDGLDLIRLALLCYWWFSFGNGVTGLVTDRANKKLIVLVETPSGKGVSGKQTQNVVLMMLHRCCCLWSLGVYKNGHSAYMLDSMDSPLLQSTTWLWSTD